jgi:hypothetical protein
VRRQIWSSQGCKKHAALLKVVPGIEPDILNSRPNLGSRPAKVS